MIEFSGFLLLGAFGIVFLVMISVIGVQIYHGFRFGRNDRLTMAVNVTFIAAVAGVIIITGLMLIPVDWSEPFSISAPSGTPSLKLPSEVPGIPSDANQFLLNE